MKAERESQGNFCHTKWCEISPPAVQLAPSAILLVAANAPPVFYRYQLRSVTDEQHVGIIMQFTKPSTLSQFGGLGLALVSLPWAASFLSMFNSMCILHSVGWGSLNIGVPFVTARPYPFSLMSLPVTLSLKIPWCERSVSGKIPAQRPFPFHRSVPAPTTCRSRSAHIQQVGTFSEMGFGRNFAYLVAHFAFSRKVGHFYVWCLPIHLAKNPSRGKGDWARDATWNIANISIPIHIFIKIYISTLILNI